MNYRDRGRAVRLDSSDARTIRGTLHLTAGAPEFHPGLAQALEQLPSLRKVDSGSGWARLVTRSHGAVGSAVVRIEIERHPQGDVLEVVITPAVRFIFGPSTAQLQALGSKLLDALDASFESSP
ncbi:hypothetical protein DEJ28_14295 [Curtobacterium sp. MCPF17_002]|uniref:hypothetical protein n=1 Tax=Curtobacterium sp. MCPF17_002 TaxID=2175645 RepID=UPI000DA7987D|nr:hypothetical protein [Curtobacterium sp. MCPF17_002]WIB76811.1 hypothetical protein DEJ28_14295 [Curtobacterium sp. MCPF17_002]